MQTSVTMAMMSLSKGGNVASRGKKQHSNRPSGGGPSRLSLQTQLCSRSAPAPARDAGLVWPHLSSLTSIFLYSRCTLGTTFLGTESSPLSYLCEL